MSIAYRKPERVGDKVVGIIPVLDIQFGNVWTNIPKEKFDQLQVQLGQAVHVRISHNGVLVDDTVAPYRRTFSEVPAGQPLV